MGECKTQIRPLSSENEIELIAQISSAGVNEFKHFSIRLSFFSHKERIKLEEIIGILHFISSQDSSPTPHPSNCCNLATLHCHLSLISRQGAERPAKQKWDVIIENDFLCRRIPGISVPPPSTSPSLLPSTRRTIWMIDSDCIDCLSGRWWRWLWPHRPGELFHQWPNNRWNGAC